MNKVIVIEGPDGSGKTTLCEALRDNHGYRIVHEGLPPAGEVPLHYYGKKLLQAFKAKKPVVFDRFHLGETVYAPLKRGKDTLNLSGVTLMERILWAYGGQLVVALPDYLTANKNWIKKFQAGNDYLMDHELYHQSYHLFARWVFRYHHFDYERHEVKCMAKVLDGRAATLYSLPFGVIGNPNGRFLFVGERPNSNALDLDLPFFNHTYASGWINDSISLAGFREEEIAFVNATNANDKLTNFRQVYDSLPNLKHIIALGSHAGRYARPGDREVGFTELRHPSYEKRFQHLKQDSYVAKLKQIRESVL